MSILNELKAEITRLSRREINKELAPVRRVNAAQRGLIANLRREVVALQKEVHALRRASPVVAADTEQQDARSGFWITGKGVKALRKRLGITQVQLARLAGVSDQTVVNWEGTEGKIAFRRKETGTRLAELRSMNKKAAAEELNKPKSK